MRTKWSRRLGVGALVAIGLLYIPDCTPDPPQRPDAAAFVWDRDETWAHLEQRFATAREQGCDAEIDAALRRLSAQVDAVHQERPGPDDPRWDAIEDGLFDIAAGLGGCPDKVDALIAVRGSLRIAAKDASAGWPKGRPARDRLYRLLYGSRGAVEELVLQMPTGSAPARIIEPAVPSATPSVEIQGVRVHSGDLLVSRGGAPTSAFIARGNDYPGNFSHVALVHVSDDGELSVIEAHIERGVTVATQQQYLADHKLRILALRLRPDHPAVASDPMLPHRAAAAALQQARAQHIPYDFAMDFTDPTEQFCSEVASAAYASVGVELWPQLSTFSTPGLARWMAGFGVRHLETHSPSDLEYDPQLRVVAEWHDPQTLRDDHVDNAVIDAMIERAETGAELRHDWRVLPLARLAKAYSVGLNLVGREGPVPEGMSATIALRAKWLAARHAEIRETVVARAEVVARERGRYPAYWELVSIARAAAAR